MESPELTQNQVFLSQLLQRVSVIGVDIDGTLSDTISATIREIRSRYGYAMLLDNWKTWNPHQIDELRAVGIVTIEDTLDLFYSILKPGGSQVVHPLPGSQEGVQRLVSAGKRLIALSGRTESSRPYTTNWLSENYPGVFQDVLLTDHDTPRQVPKYELAKQYGIELMIEDNAHYAIDLAAHGIPTILLEAPWNREVDTSNYPNIYRVKDWNELHKF